MELTNVGSIHAKVLLPPNKNTERLGRVIAVAKEESARKDSYGMRVLFDTSKREEELKEAVINYLRRSNIYFADSLRNFSFYLIKRGASHKEIIESLNRIRSILKNILTEIEKKEIEERKKNGNTKETLKMKRLSLMKRIVAFNLSRINTVTNVIGREYERKMAEVRRELRKGMKNINLAVIPPAWYRYPSRDNPHR